jgi:hypothetical protein
MRYGGTEHLPSQLNLPLVSSATADCINPGMVAGGKNGGKQAVFSWRRSKAVPVTKDCNTGNVMIPKEMIGGKQVAIRVWCAEHAAVMPKVWRGQCEEENFSGVTREIDLSLSV